MKIGIFYFSGTGNTEIIAEMLSSNFIKKDASVKLFKMDELIKEKAKIDVSEFDIIGIGHPVLGFGATGIAEIFVKTLPISEGKRAFVFKTASSHHYVNHGASDVLIKEMCKKGYKVFHNSILAMPCNWYIKYEDSMNKQLYYAALVKTKRIAKEILEGQEKTLHLNWLLGKIFRVFYYLEEEKGAKYFSAGLETNESCNLCKSCVRDCPTNNIYEENGKIHFKKECIWCMRCIYSCPKNAIIAKRVKVCVLHPFTGGFNYDKILQDDSIKGNFVTEKSKGYYKHFIEYFREVK